MSAVKKIVLFFVGGLACLVALFIILKCFPGLMTFVEPKGGFQCYYYRDADGDGRGNPADKTLGQIGEPPEGYTAVVGDCDDTDPNK